MDGQLKGPRSEEEGLRGPFFMFPTYTRPGGTR